MLIEPSAIWMLYNAFLDYRDTELSNTAICCSNYPIHNSKNIYPIYRIFSTISIQPTGITPLTALITDSNSCLGLLDRGGVLLRGGLERDRWERSPEVLEPLRHHVLWDQVNLPQKGKKTHTKKKQERSLFATSIPGTRYDTFYHCINHSTLGPSRPQKCRCNPQWVNLFKTNCINSSLKNSLDLVLGRSDSVYARAAAALQWCRVFFVRFGQLKKHKAR